MTIYVANWLGLLLLSVSSICVFFLFLNLSYEFLTCKSDNEQCTMCENVKMSTAAKHLSEKSYIPVVPVYVNINVSQFIISNAIGQQ